MTSKLTKLMRRSAIWAVVITITMFLFLAALFSEIYDLISINSTSILAITGALITLYLIIGVINWKKLKNALWGRIK